MLALNFATSTRLATIILIVLMLVVGLVFYFFVRATSVCCRVGLPEGLQTPNWFPHKWRLVLMSLVLTVLYLPLSTMAMHVVVWSDDLWVVPNPYTNSSVNPADLPALGPANEFLEPLDFCYTTTMKRNELNYAPVLVILALISLIGVRPNRNDPAQSNSIIVHHWLSGPTIPYNQVGLSQSGSLH